MKKRFMLSTLLILLILSVLPSSQVYAQSNQIAKLSLGENESVYTVYSDYQGKNFAAIILKNVVLPLPLFPKIVKISPSFIDKFILFATQIFPLQNILCKFFI